MPRTHAPGLAALMLLALSTSAGAVPLFIDFTSSDWSGAAGQTAATRSYGGLDVSLSSGNSRTLSFNAGDAPSPTASTGLLALQGDGIGIGNDEIGSGEALSVHFSSSVTVLSLHLLDLFGGEGPGGTGLEQFQADFGAAGMLSGAAQPLDATGYFAATGLSYSDVTALTLTSLGGSWSDFALAGIWIDDGVSPVSVTAVPEPGGLLLLGIGLLGVIALRSFRRLG